MQKFRARVVKPSCSEIELIPEFAFSKISLVVDLHLLVGLDLRLDSTLVVLESELGLHAGAAVWRVADEDSLAEGARVITSSLEVISNIAWLIAKHCS